MVSLIACVTSANLIPIISLTRDILLTIPAAISVLLFFVGNGTNVGFRGTSGLTCELDCTACCCGLLLLNDNLRAAFEFVFMFGGVLAPKLSFGLESEVG